jgi:uncharacterized membrane protein YvbJ
MSAISIETIVVALVAVNIVLLVASIKMGRAQSTPSLDELMRAVADGAAKTAEKG